LATEYLQKRKQSTAQQGNTLGMFKQLATPHSFTGQPVSIKVLHKQTTDKQAFTAQPVNIKA
jgi:hypothetical protein